VIYFFQRQDGVIKLGYTDDFKNRIYAHRHKHGDIKLLGVHDGGYKEEQALLKRFACYVVEGKEWFEPCEELLTYIAENTIPEPTRITSPVTINIRPETRAVLDYMIFQHLAKTGELLSLDEVLFKVFEQAFPEAVTAVLAMGAQPPVNRRKRNSA
jgi:hypothetical protein